jgi:hypothetical protein
MEGFARARGFYGFGHGAYVTAGGVVMATMQKDYYENEDVNDGLLDQLALSMPDINGSGFGFTVGRQSLTLGDGFLIGDGYRDHFAAFWNIPLSFYDGVSVNWAKEPAPRDCVRRGPVALVHRGRRPADSIIADGSSASRPRRQRTGGGVPAPQRHVASTTTRALSVRGTHAHWRSRAR